MQIVTGLQVFEIESYLDKAQHPISHLYNLDLDNTQCHHDITRCYLIIRRVLSASSCIPSSSPRIDFHSELNGTARISVFRLSRPLFCFEDILRALDEGVHQIHTREPRYALHWPDRSCSR